MNSGHQLWLLSPSLSLFFPPLKPPGSSLAPPCQPQPRTCVTADVGKLDSVHRVENHNTRPAALEMRPPPPCSCPTFPIRVCSTSHLERLCCCEDSDNFRDRRKCGAASASAVTGLLFRSLEKSLHISSFLLSLSKCCSASQQRLI